MFAGLAVVLALFAVMVVIGRDEPTTRVIQLPAISTEGVHCFCVGPNVGKVFTENGGTQEECERTCAGPGYGNAYQLEE